MIAKCIENNVQCPSYSLGADYKITEEGLASNFWPDTPGIDSWNGPSSTELKPELKDGVVFKRKGCKFIIRKEEGE